MLVAEIDVLVVVEIESARIIEHRAEVSRGHSLIARAEQALQGESTKTDHGQDVLKAFVVRVSRYSVIRGWAVEFGKK
jgi:hypothetical protein